MRGLSGCVVAEGLLALAILGVVAALSVTPPARHEAPAWPFGIRLSVAALEGATAEATRTLIGSQIAVLGLVAMIAGVILRTWRLPLVALALVALGAGAGLALPPLAIDAYPTTYLRPSVPYHAASIAVGAAPYRESCPACHGPKSARAPLSRPPLPPPPPPLRPPPPSP